MRAWLLLICILLLYNKLIPLKAQVADVQDSLALVEFYKSTNGPVWCIDCGWLSNPVSEWAGIKLDNNGRVIRINLQYMNLSGTLPTLDRFTKLEDLLLNGNEITGPIPNLDQLVSLKKLSLISNKMSGTIPSLDNLINLQLLDVNNNNLTGVIPSLDKLVNLEWLAVNANPLSGTIPSLEKLTKLRYLYLDRTNLSGTIPSLNNLVNLIYLSLNNTQVSGVIPSLDKLTKLVFLYLTNNQLSGPIPSLNNLTNLVHLRLGNNRLSGNIPFLNHLFKLGELELDSNQLVGPVPAMNALIKLKTLNVSSNRLNFSGLEEVATMYNFARYSPQDIIPIKRNGDLLTAVAGGNIKNNTYKWYRDNQLIATHTGDSVFKPAGCGNYSVVVSNSIATQLLLYSDTLSFKEAPQVAIKASSTNICSGTPVTFTATVTNAGTSTAYQWKKNGLMVGTDTTFYTDNNLADGDSITFELTDHTVCGSILVKSNTIIMEVTTSTAKPVTLGSDTTICDRNSIVLNAGSGYISYQWQDGSADSIYNVTQSGTYHVQVKDGCGRTFIDTVKVTISDVVNFDLGADVSVCQKDSVTLKAPDGFNSYQWSPSYNISGTSGQVVAVYPFTSTVYTVTAKASSGCLVKDSLKVSVQTASPVSLGRDTSFCSGDGFFLMANGNYSSFLWSTGAVTRSIEVNRPGIYSIKAEDAGNGCYAYDTVEVKMLNLPVISLSKDSFLCQNNSKTLDAGAGYASYLWNTGSTEQRISVNNLGTYSVQVTDNNGCKASDSVSITSISPAPSGFLFSDTAVCRLSSISLTANNNFITYLWSTGATTRSIEVQQPGMYWLEVADEHGCTGKDTVQVRDKQCTEGFFIPTAFTPNRDGKNDSFKPVIFGTAESYRFTIFNRWGEKVFESFNPGKGWDGTYKGYTLPTATYIWQCTFKLSGKQMVEKGTVLLIK